MSDQPHDTYAGSATYHSTIRIVDNGQPPSKDVLNASAKDLADRCQALNQYIGTGTLGYPGSATYPATIDVPANSGTPTAIGVTFTQVINRTEYLKARTGTGTTNVTGSAASYPASIPVPAISTTPTVIGAADQALANRCHWLKAQSCGFGEQEYATAGTFTWNRPGTDAQIFDLELVVVGAGEEGADGAVNTGGAGGRAGEVTLTRLTGLVPASLEVTVGTNGRSSWVRNPTPTTVAFAAGGGIQDTPADMAAASLRADQPNGAPGGAGGTAGLAGSRGKTSSHGIGGAGGAVNVAGSRGLGYGAGGGGGRQASGTTAGGGGGGGGFGHVVAAANGSNSTGGNGADGYVLIRWKVALVAL